MITAQVVIIHQYKKYIIISFDSVLFSSVFISYSINFKIKSTDLAMTRNKLSPPFIREITAEISMNKPDRRLPVTEPRHEQAAGLRSWEARWLAGRTDKGVGLDGLFAKRVSMRGCHTGREVREGGAGVGGWGLGSGEGGVKGTPASMIAKGIILLFWAISFIIVIVLLVEAMVRLFGIFF